MNYIIVLAGCTSILSWLLPNHYLPWTTFHSDVVMSAGYCVLGLAIWIAHIKDRVSIDFFHVSILLLSVCPVVYKFIGVVPYWTQVLLPCIYVLGLLHAALLGQLMHRRYPIELEFLIFIPPLVAAFFSVSIQLQQWLHLPSYGMTDIWISQSNGIRPAANLNQPNQLGSLLLWALVSAVWLVRRRYVGLGIFCILACYLAIGIGLTLSRTALLGFLAISIIFLLLYRKQINKKQILVWVAVVVSIGLAWSAHAVVPHMLNILPDSTSGLEGVGRNGGIRFRIWQLFLHAFHEKMLFGYGPQMTISAQYTQMDKFQDLAPGLYASAHNLFVDFLIWYGAPITLFLLVVFMYWIRSIAEKNIIKGDAADLALAMLLIVLVHSMFEMPMHHAYFLLPTGLLIGKLTASRVRARAFLSFGAGGYVVLLFVVSCVIFLNLLVQEYIEIERQVENYRFKAARILNSATPMVPESLILDQLADQLWFNLLDPNALISKNDLDRAAKFVSSYQNCETNGKLYRILTVNEQTKDAKDVSSLLMQRCLSK